MRAAVQSSGAPTRGRSRGSRIAGRYRVEERLGRGGMGTVYKVVDESTGGALALKELGGNAALEDPAWQGLRFRREFHTVARLRHPRVVRAYDYGIDREVPFYTMELLDGRDLRDLGPVAAPDACRLLRDVASALAFLHSKRLIHRDLAPRNIRCTGDGRAKLIDFGVLATAGTFGDIAGTPPFVAPETVRGLPLDHRADLFGLGALAYWLLTGRHAFPARHIQDLEGAWTVRPEPPSAHAEVPQALDDLVASLLSIDPLGRPAAAAEVLDRLGAIGGLEPPPAGEAARGYLASAILVGRRREMDLCRRQVERAQRGLGAAFVVEAPSGGGKSRLLREIGLEAQLAGATVLRADSESAGRGPYGLLRALSLSLLAAAPDQAIEAARARAPVIGRILPELEKRLRYELLPSVGDPTEERARLQSQLTQWISDVAAKHTLVLLVDDAQRSDEASAAVLATLAHDAGRRRLLMAVGLRTDETLRAPFAIAALRDAASRIRLRGLEVRDVEALVRGLFGEVPHVARFARWLQKAGAGSPLHCLELTRHLVDHGHIRYADGVWSLPEGARLSDLPVGLAAAMDARVAALGPGARSLGEALSVHGGEIPLPLAMLLADRNGGSQRGTQWMSRGRIRADGDDRAEAAVFSALDELIQEEVLLVVGDSHRFRHDAVREALLRGLDVERRRRLHLRVGTALAAQGEVTPEREAEVGWHLLRGGERTRGADLLARAGRRLFAADSLSDAIAPLEAALEVFEEGRRSPRAVLELRHMLVMIGCLIDRDVALRYSDDTLATFQQLSGMGLTRKLRPWMGAYLSFLTALLLATLSWIARGPWRRPNPIAALMCFYVEVTYAASMRALSFHHQRLAELVPLLEPLSVFGSRMPKGAWILTRTMRWIVAGDWRRAHDDMLELLGILESDRLTPLTEMDRKNAAGAALYTLAMGAALNQDSGYVRDLARLEAVGLRFFDVSAQICRVIYHRFRGEEETALAIEQEVEVQLVQLGSLYGLESHLVWKSAYAYGHTRDMLGLRRCIEGLARLTSAGFALEPALELARGEYLRERGELAASRESLEHALERLGTEEILFRPAAYSALAETHLAMGALDEAIRCAEKAVELSVDSEFGNVTWKLRGQKVIALADAAAGRLESAAERLDAAIAAAEPIASPSISGALHEARVRVAARAGDTLAYETNLHATRRWFAMTKNPAFVARLERLPAPPAYTPGLRATDGDAIEQTRPASPGARGPAAETTGALTCDAVVTGILPFTSALLQDCRGPAERAARALGWITDVTGAVSGYLFLCHGGALALAAPLYGEEPPEPVTGAIRRQLEAKARGIVELDTSVEWHPGDGPEAVPWRSIPLVAPLGAGEAVVGAVAIVQGAVPLSRVPAGLVERLARELYEAGDAAALEGLTT